MQNIVIDKPYTPVLPHRGRLWPRLLAWYVPRMLRVKYGVTRIEFLHEDRLARSIAAGHGVLLTPNHCRDEDPIVLGMLTRRVGTPFFLMASWHVFMQGRIQAYFLRRAGAFSIYREGIDRGAVSTAVEILERAERPLVLFPEGFVSRTNDRLNVLMDGTALIARSAAKKRAEQKPPGKVVVHPVAIRYRFEGSVERAVAPALDEIEARLTWRSQDRLPLVERIHHVGGALLALKEIEYLGRAGHGEIGARLNMLTDAILSPLEMEWLGKKREDDVPARVKRLRTAILPDMATGQIDEPERERRWRQLADLYFAQQLFHYPPDYLASNPTPERLLETVERLEEDLTDKVRPHGSIHATITIGEPVEASPTREGRGGNDPLMERIEGQLRAMLGLDDAA
jgi:1-acyl-sn-glycerol-3-phosphate acyltransferase